MTRRCRVVLVSGSLRSNSTNTALLRTAQLVAPDEVAVVLYDGLDVLTTLITHAGCNPTRGMTVAEPGSSGDGA